MNFANIYENIACQLAERFGKQNVALSKAEDVVMAAVTALPINEGETNEDYKNRLEKFFGL